MKIFEKRCLVAISFFVVFSVIYIELLRYQDNAQTKHDKMMQTFGQLYSNENDSQQSYIYKGEKLFTNYEQKENIPNNENACDRWIVVSPEHIPMKAVEMFKYITEKKDSVWCSVAILHKKSIEAEYVQLKSERFIVLTQEEQNLFLNSYPENIVQHFGMNIGFIYAIIHGAKVIYDTTEYSRLDYPSIPTFEEIEDYVLVSSDEHLFPSYQSFLAQAPAGLWIDGFYNPPSDKVEGYHYLKDNEFNCTNFKKENVKIIKLVKKSETISGKEMPFTKLQLALRQGTFAIYDSTSILYDYTAFFALFRREKNQVWMTDNIRNLYIQRILCEIGFNMGFIESPINPTNFTSNRNGSVERYHNIVTFLLQWKSKSLTVVEIMEQLAIRFYEKGYWGMDAVLNVQAWLTALIEAGYNFPIISKTHKCFQAMSSEIKNCNSKSLILEEKGKKSSKLDLYLRMSTVYFERSPPLAEFYDKIFAWTAKFFWQKSNPMSLILVLDDEKDIDHQFGVKREKRYPYPRVYYETDLDNYGPYPKNRMQWSMHWADNYTTKEYVGFIDSDSWFNTIVNEDMFFEGDKPHVHGFYGSSLDGWSADAKHNTYEFLKLKQVFRAMNYFPVVVKTKHLIELRKYIEKVHSQSFDEVFTKIVLRNPNIAQFHIMMNYVWYYHRDEYIWHMEESQVVTDFDGDNELTEFQEFTDEMKKPFPKLILHYKRLRESVNVAENWDPFLINEASLQTRNKLMLEGYCFSGGFKLTPDMCTDFDKDGIRISFFDFEYHSWLWDDRCLETQRKHYSQTSGLKHKWDLSMLNDF